MLETSGGGASTSTGSTQTLVDGTTLIFEVYEDVLFGVHGQAEPNDDEWKALLQLEMANRSTKVLAFVPKESTGPSAAQRRELTQARQDSGSFSTTAIVTESRLHRGIVTALSWVMGQQIRAFAPSALDEARQHLQVEQHLWNRCLKRAWEMSVALKVADECHYLKSLRLD